MHPQLLILLLLLPLFQDKPRTGTSEPLRSPELGWAETLREIHFPISPKAHLVWVPGEDWDKGKRGTFYHRLLDFPLELRLSAGRTSLFPPAQIERWRLRGETWIQDLLLPHLVRQSAELAPDPGPGRRGLAGLPQRAESPRPWKRFVSRAAQGLPAFGFFERTEKGIWVPARLERLGFPETCSRLSVRKHQALPWNQKELDQQWNAYEHLLQDFLDRLRWPLPKLPRSWKRRMLPDDGVDRGGIEDHEALDLGALVQREDGRFGVWPEGVPVSSPLSGAEAIPAPREDGRGFALRLQRGRFKLLSLVFLYHLAPKGPPRLEGFSPREPLLGWERRDPAARLAGLPKGNHVHLELLGPFKGKEGLFRLFLAHRVKRSLLAAPSSGPRLSPFLLPKSLPPAPWIKGRRLLAQAFQSGLESPPSKLDRASWRRRLQAILPLLPPRSRMEQLLEEFLKPLLQVISR
ncbi:MAG TPA: hypothetical protein ENK02_10890 [Planctomycetes bacterium]|nr:hypothetical protein [Planctomycetota bacterium]